jgi:hypothetical protein
MELLQVKAVVKFLLETEPNTRNNDGLLYVRVCQCFNPSIDQFPFGVVMANQKQFNIPSAETVRRARQKLQAEFEHLKANKQVKEHRAVQEMKYKSFALDLIYE